MSPFNSVAFEIECYMYMYIRSTLRKAHTRDESNDDNGIDNDERTNERNAGDAKADV